MISCFLWPMTSKKIKGSLFFKKAAHSFPVALFSPLLFLFAAECFAQNPAPQIAQLNAQGRAIEAYDLSMRALSQWEGEPSFDLHYGVAAVDSGRASEGVFALERVLMNQPGNDYARLELGRAYFALEEDDRAEHEFMQVLESNPPEEVVQNVQPYLNAIQARRAKRETTVVANLEFGTGYDSNLLAAPDSSTFFIPLLGDDATLASAVIGDVFYQANADVTVSHPIRYGTNVFGTARTSFRKNDEGFETLPPNPTQPVGEEVGQDQTFSYGVRAGLTHEAGASNIRVALEYDVLELDERGYRDSYGLRGSWRYAWTPQSSATVFGQVHDLDYQDLTFRDSTMSMGGLTFQHLFIAPMRPILTIGGTVGNENAHNNTNAALSTADRDIYGANIGLTLSPVPRWQVNVGADIQDSQYTGLSLNALPAGSNGGEAQVRRDDTQSTLRLGVSWLAMENLLLRLDGAKGNTDSNIAIFDYDRDQIILSMRYTYR